MLRASVFGAIVLAATAGAGQRVTPNAPTDIRRAESPRSAPRILVMYDFEGASGVANGRMMDREHPGDFAKGRESLVSDVATVVAALFEGGASAVDVLNTHGDLDPTLVPAARLDKRVRVRTRQEMNSLAPYHPDVARALAGQYDAIVAIGMHTKPLTGGFSPHTMGAGLSPVIGNAAVTETELVGYSFGTIGVPVIMASGDDVLQRDLAIAMPWVEYVVVKRSSGPDAAEPLPAEQVRSELRRGASRALAGLDRMRPMRITAPVRAGLLATFPMVLPPGLKNGGLPGISGSGDTVVFTAQDYRAAWVGIRVLMTIAAANGAMRSIGFLQGRPGAREALRELADSTNAEWTAFEIRAIKSRVP